MVQRIGYGLSSLVALIGAFMADVSIARACSGHSGWLAALGARGSVVPLLVVSLLLRAAVEMNRLCRAAGSRPHQRWVLLMILLLVLSPWLSAAGWLGRGPAQVEGLFWQFVWLAAAAIGAGMLTVLRREPGDALRDFSITVAIITYLGFLPAFGLQLRCGLDSPDQDGAWLLLITVLVIKASDIGAYLVGSAIGRHKLLPRISPGKSVEGAAAGLIAGAGAALLFVWLHTAASAAVRMQVGEEVPAALSQQGWFVISDATAAFSQTGARVMGSSWIMAIVFGFLLSFFAQFGDLLESCFKRDAGAKDSGRVIPQFGGILDLVDSPVLGLPVGWFLLTYVWNIV